MTVAASLKFSVDGVNWGTTGPTNYTTSAFTPANDSLLVVTINSISFSSNQLNCGVSSSPSLTWTRQVRAASNGSLGPPVSEIWTAPVTIGASTTVTISASADNVFSGDGTSSSITITEITGHDTVGNFLGLTASDSVNGSTTGALSVSMGGTTASDSMVIATVAADGDHGAALVNGGSGWTELSKTQSGTGGWFRSTTEYEIGALTSYDYGALNDPYQHTSAGMEIKAAAGAPSYVPYNPWPQAAPIMAQ